MLGRKKTERNFRIYLFAFIAFALCFATTCFFQESKLCSFLWKLFANVCVGIVMAGIIRFTTKNFILFTILFDAGVGFILCIIYWVYEGEKYTTTNSKYVEAFAILFWGQAIRTGLRFFTED